MVRNYFVFHYAFHIPFVLLGEAWCSGNRYICFIFFFLFEHMYILFTFVIKFLKEKKWPIRRLLEAYLAGHEDSRPTLSIFNNCFDLTAIMYYIFKG